MAQARQLLPQLGQLRLGLLELRGVLDTRRLGVELLGGGVDCRPVPPTGPVRTNLTVTEPDGTTTIS